MIKTPNNVLEFKRPTPAPSKEPIREATEKLLVEFQNKLRELREKQQS